MGPAGNASAAPEDDVQPTAPPQPDPHQTKTSRKSKALGSNVLRLFKMRDDANPNPKAPHAVDASQPLPPSSVAAAATEPPAVPRDPTSAAAPPESTAPSPDDAASQSEQQSAAGSRARTGNDGEGGKRWSVRKMLKRRNGPSSSSDRSKTAGAAPPRAGPEGGDSPAHSIAEVVLLGPLAPLEPFDENSLILEDDEPPSASVLPDARPPIPEEAGPPGTSLLPEVRPLITVDAAQPKTSMLPGARGAPDGTSLLRSSPPGSQVLSSSASHFPQRDVPLRRSSIIPHVSYPIPRVSPTPNAGPAATATLQPPVQRSRSLSVPQVLGLIADDEEPAVDSELSSGSGSTTLVPGSQTSPPRSVASTGQRTRRLTCPDMSVLLHRLSLMESRLLAGDALTEGASVEEDPATVEASNGTSESSTPLEDYFALTESLLNLHGAQNPEDDEVGANQNPVPQGDERVRQTGHSSAPVVASTDNPMCALPQPPTGPLPSPPRSCPAPWLAPPESPIQPAEPWDGDSDGYGHVVGGNDEPDLPIISIRPPSESGDGPVLVPDSMKSVKAELSIRIPQSVVSSATNGSAAEETCVVQLPQVITATIDAHFVAYAPADRPAVTQTYEHEDSAVAVSTENLSGQDFALGRFAVSTDGCAPQVLDGKSREELVDHIQQLYRALAWSASSLRAKDQEVQRLCQELKRTGIEKEATVVADDSSIATQN